MKDPFSLTHRNGRKFPRRRQRQMALLKALGETGSVVHAAAIVDVDRITPYAWRNTFPGFASFREAPRKRVSWRPTSHGAASADAPSNQPVGNDAHSGKRRKAGVQVTRPVMRGTPAVGTEKTISFLPASAAHGVSPETPGKANGHKEVKGF